VNWEREDDRPKQLRKRTSGTQKKIKRRKYKYKNDPLKHQLQLCPLILPFPKNKK